MCLSHAGFGRSCTGQPAIKAGKAAPMPNDLVEAVEARVASALHLAQLGVQRSIVAPRFAKTEIHITRISSINARSPLYTRPASELEKVLVTCIEKTTGHLNPAPKPAPNLSRPPSDAAAPMTRATLRVWPARISIQIQAGRRKSHKAEARQPPPLGGREDRLRHWCPSTRRLQVDVAKQRLETGPNGRMRCRREREGKRSEPALHPTARFPAAAAWRASGLAGRRKRSCNILAPQALMTTRSCRKRG